MMISLGIHLASFRLGGNGIIPQCIAYTLDKSDIYRMYYKYFFKLKVILHSFSCLILNKSQALLDKDSSYKMT